MLFRGSDGQVMCLCEVGELGRVSEGEQTVQAPLSDGEGDSAGQMAVLDGISAGSPFTAAV